MGTGLDKGGRGGNKSVDLEAAQEFEALPLGDDSDGEESTHSSHSAHSDRSAHTRQGAG